MADTNKGEYYYGMGRRKTAVARVRLYPNGDGSITINGKPASAYFGPRETSRSTYAPVRLDREPVGRAVLHRGAGTSHGRSGLVLYLRRNGRSAGRPANSRPAVGKADRAISTSPRASEGLDAIWRIHGPPTQIQEPERSVGCSPFNAGPNSRGCSRATPLGAAESWRSPG